MGIEHLTSGSTKGKHKRTGGKEKETGNRNITPIVALRHCQNTLIAIDVSPGVGVIDIIIISTQGGRTNTTKLDGGSMDVCSSGVSAIRSTESLSRREGGKSVCQRRRHWMK